MKKVLAGISLVVCLLACVCAKSDDRQVVQKTERELQKEQDIADFKKAVTGTEDFPKESVDVVEFTYKNHDYIWFTKSRHYSERGFGFAGVVHDPECSYCLEKYD